MEAVAATAIMGILMLVALSLLGRSWPRSSRLGGHRARARDGGSEDVRRSEERGEAIREDDDLRWRWEDRDHPR
jgi:hypothetical protein